MKKTIAYCLFGLCLLLTTGCEETNTTVLPSEPEADIAASVNVLGSVRPLTGGFQCTDQSRCFEGATEVPCRDVIWDAVNQSTGIVLNAQAGEPKSTVQFSGVPGGDYRITQCVTHRDAITSRCRDHNVAVD